MTEHYYIAYGSNLHPQRLIQRVGETTPLARLKLQGLALCFRKRGADGSGKCDLKPAPSQSYGVLYPLSEAQFNELDRYEGGYQHQTLMVQLNDKTLTATTYCAKRDYRDDTLTPLDWYRQLVTIGAQQMGFPASYQQQLASVAVQTDADDARATQHQQLITELLTAPIQPALPWGEVYSAATIS